ncbi:limbic system-associated membrane protein-like [Haliotis asinina]|uniref:limbic system-associated membrane protein-like n=1 Tax=Haliotis asinina TaxID=109174 RepID=UPI0035318EE0
MTRTIIQQVLLLVTCLFSVVRCESITLDTSATDTILGHPVTLTCRVSDAAVGLVIFMMQESGTYAVVCRIMATTGNVVRTPPYTCFRDEEQQHTYSLTVARTSLKHRTSWMCQAAGMKSSIVHLDIQYIEYFGVTSGKRGVTVAEHDNVTMQCNTNSSPVSSIEIRDETASLGSGTNSSTVEARIEDVDCLQAGPYTCSARNLIGQAVERNISLQVKCAPRPDGFTPGGPVFRSALNRTITLSLTVVAFPVPTFTWNTTSGGQPLTNTNVTAEGVRATGSVTISDVKEMDFQNYTVIVANTEGTRMLNVMLIPLSQPDTPRNVHATSIMPGSVTLTWDKGSNGGARQRFRIQYRQDGGPWITHPATLSEDDDLRLELGGLDSDTTYTVRLLAFSEHGSSDYTSISFTTSPNVTDSGTVVMARGTACAAVVIFLITTV